MSLWQTGDVVGPTNLNAKGASATSIAGFSSNTLRAESGNTLFVQPYSTGVVLKSIDSGGRVWDARAFGAVGDGITDDTTALVNTISAVSAAGGGVVYLPAGAYKISSPLTLPDTTVESVHLIGQGLRDVTIRPTTSVHTAVLVGANHNSPSYGMIADLTITAIDTSGHTGCGLHMIQPQHWSVQRVNIESFTSGTGLYLEGSATSSPPHAYRNQFERMLISSCQRPGYMINADENTFITCGFGLPTDISSSSVTALEINQGRNNRFFSTLFAGDSSDLTNARPHYTGLLASDPIISGGANGYNQFYGLVAEGFEKGIVINSTLEQGYMIIEYHSSINSVDIQDGGQDTINISPQQVTAKFGGAYPFSPAVNVSAGSQIPNVQKGNVFGTANTSLTTIVGFANAQSGQMFWLRIGSNDSQTVLQDSSASLRLWGRSNLTCSQEMIIPMIGIGGVVYQAGLPILPRAPTISISTNLFESPLPFAARADGSAIAPQYTFTSDDSLGFYRSGTSSLGLSYGTLNLRNAALSLRTTASSASASNLTNGEICLVAVSTTSAQLAFRSGNTTYVFNAVQASP